ncbi:MAG: hypothetical protein JNK82_17615 [Myxococcaceae bacterium]|nr:hypothetical protein [Myxococcaceae bacterium]
MRFAVVALLVGYVMPSYSVIKRMAERRDKLELTALKVDGTVTVPAPAAADYANALGVTAATGELVLNGTVSMRFPARCRLELGSLDSTKTVAAVSANGKRRTEGAEIAALQVAADEICAVLALRGADDGDSRASVERHLSALKIDTRQSSLARFSGNLAYVVGNPAAGSPQLWVFKSDAFQPARLRFNDDKGVQWDVKFIDYASQASDTFPRLVEVWKGDALQLRFTTLGTDVKPKLDDKAF